MSKICNIHDSASLVVDCKSLTLGWISLSLYKAVVDSYKLLFKPARRGKCQMVYNCIWTVLANIVMGNPPPPTHHGLREINKLNWIELTHTSIALDCSLCSDTTMKIQEKYNSNKTVGCLDPPPPPWKKILDPPRRCIGTQSLLFLSWLQLKSSVLSRILVTFGLTYTEQKKKGIILVM